MKDFNSCLGNGQQNYWKVKVLTSDHLDYSISDYFGDLSVVHRSDGTTLLIGELHDLSEVYGFLFYLRDQAVVLRSLRISLILP